MNINAHHTELHGTGGKVGRKSDVCYKGQSELLNLMIVVLAVSALFAYFFFVTNSQKGTNTKTLYNLYRYNYAEICIQNLYHVTSDGENLATLLGYAVYYGNASRDFEINGIKPKTIINDYFNKTISDFDYYFYVDCGPGKDKFEINTPPGETTEFLAHKIDIPLPAEGEEVSAYLYIW